MQRGTFQLMKSVNKSIVLNKIRTSEPISRAQIAKDTKLTPPTVSSIVRELIEQDLVMESTLGKSLGGRKPTMLLVNKNGFYVIGIDAGPKTIKCILSNLSGQIQNQVKVLIDSTGELTNEKFLALVKDAIHEILKEVDNREKILGIGLAIHGVVDITTGTSLVVSILKLRDIPIKEVLEQEFHMEVHIENDAGAMALGESWFGDYGNVSNMITIHLGSGVGAGVIIDGKLYHGAADLAGEVGHMTIDMYGDDCECGNKGCLETFASAPSIVKHANKRMPNKNIQSSKEVYELAVQGDRDCIDLLQQTGGTIGIGLVNLIHILNPEMIIIGGGVSKAEKFILKPIQETIKQRGLTKEAKETPVVISEVGDNATILGSVALLLEKLFDPR